MSESTIGDQQARAQAAHSHGLVAGLGGVARNGLGLLLNRVELAALELSEVRTGLVRLLLVFALGVLAAWFAIAYWSAVIVFAAWPSLGWKIIPILGVGFTLAAAGIFYYAQAMLKRGALSMPATMAELRNDREALL